MIHALLGEKRFAHLQRLEDDRAVATILGFKRGRICGQDAFVRLMSRADRQKAPSWMAACERNLYAALPAQFIASRELPRLRLALTGCLAVVDLRLRLRFDGHQARYGHQEVVEVG